MVHPESESLHHATCPPITIADFLGPSYEISLLHVCFLAALQSSKVGTCMVPILQMRKLRWLRKVKGFGQSHRNRGAGVESRPV